MYLQSLELQGFKSFPDKIKLNFDKGITAVVGPNGSGKSNIGDAVRWVLGEQSSKTLRGGKMEDVIFAGTVDRKAVSFASVTLNIVNDKHLIAIDSETVSVTRKLYRSGESEYRINGENVRLRDILELFMDTGLGRDGYSIIGQGRVAEIVSAKSGERREIFEEAAGISKFRYKKNEALRKLNAAEENIIRLSDILNELEVRVEPLRVQSEKAAKFIELSSEKKELEITVWVSMLEKHKEELSEISDKLLINKNEYNVLNSQSDELSYQDEKIAEEITALNIKIEELREMILEKERENTKIHTEIAVCENDILHSEEKIFELDEILAKREIVEAETKDKIEKAKAKAEELREQATTDSKKYIELTEKFTSEKVKQDSFDSEYDEIKSNLNMLYIKKSEVTVHLETSYDNKKNLEERNLTFLERDEKLRVEREDIEQEKFGALEAVELVTVSITENENKLSGLNRLASGKKEKLSSALKEFDDVNFSLRDKAQRIKMLTELENNMEGFAFSVKQVLKASKSGQLSGIFGTTASLLNVPADYSVAIETALGGALQNLVVNNEDTAKRAIRFLKDGKFGRATFLPLTSIKSSFFNERGLEDFDGFVGIAVDLVEFEPVYKNIFSSLLGRIVVASDIDSATIISKKYGYKFKIVTLDGQVINAGGSFTGGAVSKSSGQLTRKNDIEKLQAESRNLEEKSAELRKSVDKLQAETEKFGYDIEDINDKIQVSSTDKIRFEAEIKRLESLLLQNEELQKSYQKEALEFESNLENIEKSILENKNVLLEIEENIEKFKAEISQSEELKSEMITAKENLAEELSSLKIHENDLVKDLEMTENEIARLEDELVNCGADAMEIVAEKDAKSQIISDKKANILKLQEELANFKENVENINLEISNKQSCYRDFERKTNENRVKLREISDNKEKFSREITRLEEKHNSVQNAYDKIISEMAEQYEIYYSEACEIAREVENLFEVQKELASVKQKIKSLGTVNLSAIEEYEEVSTRYKFLSEQLSDVNKSKAELGKLIDELTEKMCKMFSDSFAEINRNFKEIFVDLFGGGNAELVLLDPENVLESGIEIRVAPPGKVIKNLSLLSGGEQAFVAIAIYFSILRLKPSPFCILDEIEAALDEINVVKYAKYLREFTDTTQFILVTHRRGSMDEADILYGVTMQDKGISKILRLEQNV